MYSFSNGMKKRCRRNGYATYRSLFSSMCGARAYTSHGSLSWSAWKPGCGAGSSVAMNRTALRYSAPWSNGFLPIYARFIISARRSPYSAPRKSVRRRANPWVYAGSNASLRL